MIYCSTKFFFDFTIISSVSFVFPSNQTYVNDSRFRIVVFFSTKFNKFIGTDTTILIVWNETESF